MLLAPSKIYFISDISTNGLNLTPDDQTLISSLSKMCENSGESLPKIQVSEKGGAYFALNNSSLHVYRELEKQGRCTKIAVDVVDLSKVPGNLQRGMIVRPVNSCANEDKNSGVVNAVGEGQSNEFEAGEDTKKGYQKVPIENIMHVDGSHQNSVPQVSSIVETQNVVVGESDGTSSYTGTDYSDQDEEQSETECDEDLTCNVCDRSFDSTRQLALHQQKKRHFGCSICDSIFPSLMRLEHHKEALDHWSDDEGNSNDSESDGQSEEDEGVERKGEELERLL
ncbi:Uncharacterised protein g5956 [Pycnogonum litorale]